MKAFQWKEGAWCRTSAVILFGHMIGTTDTERTFWFTIKGCDDLPPRVGHVVHREYAVQFQNAIREEFGVCV